MKIFVRNLKNCVSLELMLKYGKIFMHFKYEILDHNRIWLGLIRYALLNYSILLGKTLQLNIGISDFPSELKLKIQLFLVPNSMWR